MDINFDLDINQLQDFPAAVFHVSISGDSSETDHTVRLSEEYWEKLTGGKVSAEDLVRASFEFLLKRESNEAILQEFDLKSIAEYFPEYENTIQQTL